MISSAPVPIDLTQEDEDKGQRQPKRARTDSTTTISTTTTYPQNYASSYPYSSSASTPYVPQASWAPQNSSEPSSVQSPYSASPTFYRQTFPTPSPHPMTQPSYFPEGRYGAQLQQPQPSYSSQHAYAAEQTPPQAQQPQLQSQQQPLHSYQQQPSVHNVIDLTGTGTPPPTQNGAVLKDVRRDVVCIGQILATALVLYPIPYVCLQQASAAGLPIPSGEEFVPVRLKYDDASKKRARFPQQQHEETIQITVPTQKSPSGESIGGEDFGVVEQRIATVLGPLMQKVLIRLEATVKRSMGSSPILPLRILVFTPRGNVKVVANYLSGGSILLEHPSVPYNPAAHRDMPPYENPHNPPIGGSDQRYPAGQNRWSQQAVAGKSVEVQRSQVDEVFKSLRSGEDLAETEGGN